MIALVVLAQLGQRCLIRRHGGLLPRGKAVRRIWSMIRTARGQAFARGSPRSARPVPKDARQPTYSAGRSKAASPSMPNPHQKGRPLGELAGTRASVPARRTIGAKCCRCHNQSGESPLTPQRDDRPRRLRRRSAVGRQPAQLEAWGDLRRRCLSGMFYWMLGRRFRAWRLARISVRRWPEFVCGKLPGSRARRLRRAHALGHSRVSLPPSVGDIPHSAWLCRVGYVQTVAILI